MAGKDYVLGRFTAEQRERDWNPAIARACGAIVDLDRQRNDRRDEPVQRDEMKCLAGGHARREMAGLACHAAGHARRLNKEC